MRLRATMVLAALFLLPTAASAQNQPPVADAGEDQTVFLTSSVALHGTATDPDDDPIAGWFWEVESSPPGSSPLLTAAFSSDAAFESNVAGDYILSLIAFDGTEWSVPDLVIITYVQNEPPTAVGLATPTTGPAPLTVQFDGTGSFDPEGQPLVYLWEFGDSTPPVLEAAPVHTYENRGTYFAQLRVEDDSGQPDFDTIEITVTEPPPVPALSPLGTAVLVLLLLGSAAFVLRRVRGEPH
jgi:hypothetical protein